MFSIYFHKVLVHTFLKYHLLFLFHNLILFDLQSFHKVSILVSYPASIGEFMEICEHSDFSVLDVENLRLHYAQTLTHWMDNFTANQDQVTEMYDEHFTRAWRLYLAGSIAAFRAGSLQLFQVVFTHGDNNQLPQSRQELYTFPATPEGV